MNSTIYDPFQSERAEELDVHIPMDEQSIFSVRLQPKSTMLKVVVSPAQFSPVCAFGSVSGNLS